MFTFGNDNRKGHISFILGHFFDIFQVSIEFGLCEMMNREAIRPNVAPKDGNFSFNISELEGLLPAGTVDHNVEKVYPEV